MTITTSKHQVFIEKYLSEKDRQRQLTFLKDYMLSLTLEELKAFVLEPLRFFGNALKENKLSPVQKKRLFKELDSVIALLKMKTPAKAAG